MVAGGAPVAPDVVADVESEGMLPGSAAEFAVVLAAVVVVAAPLVGAQGTDPGTG